jgi:transposase
VALKKTRDGITKAGNGHVRRLITESTSAYRHPARKAPCIEQQAKHTTQEVQDIAWKAQTRLCSRYQMLEARRKLKVQVITAIARELTGFIWAIGQLAAQSNEKNAS